MDKNKCSSCGETKCSCKNKDFTKAVIEIDNPGQITLMRKVVVPASMGDDTAVPPVVGKYHNVLLYYEANQKSYLYSSDGIPTQLVNGITNYEDAINLPQINGVTLLGDKSAADLKLADAPMVITVASGNTSWSGADTAEDVYDFFLNKGKVNIVFSGGENYTYEIASAGYIENEGKLLCVVVAAPTQNTGGVTDFDGNALFGTMTLYTAGKAVDVSQIELQPKLYIADFTGLDLNYDTLSGVPATNYSIGMVKPGDGLEVASDGTLSVIAHVFDTVADMVASTDLQNGDYAQTLGHSTVNDGGQAIYYITSATDSNEWQETISSGLYATLIGPLSPENTGLPVDTLINNWNTKKELEFGKGKSYTATSTITIRDVKTYDFHNSTIFYDGSSTVDDVINIGYDNHADGVIMRLYAGIKNLYIDCNSKARNGLHISGGKALQFQNIKVLNPLNYGLLADNSVGQNWELNLNNIHSSATNASGQALSAIKITNVTDSNFSNLYPVNGSDCWLYANTGWCTFTNIHGYKFPDTNDYTQTQGIDVYGNRNNYTNIIIDTADSLGITNHGQNNVFTNISLDVKANGVGISNLGSHSSYKSLAVRKALSKIIDTPTLVSYLDVSDINVVKDSTANAYPAVDLAFDDNKIPLWFTYDFSGRAVTPLKSILQSIKTITAPDTAVEFDLPTFNSNDYLVQVVPRDKAIPFQVARTSSKVTVTVNSSDLPSGSVSFSIYVRPNN